MVQTPPKAHQIFYFDPLKDEFFEFPLPLPLTGEHNNVLGLGVLDRCLCLVRYLDPEGIGHEFDVVLLVMKEYGVGESWTSLFTIPCIPCGPATFKGLVMVPFCFRKNGEVLVALNGEKILVYDPQQGVKKTSGNLDWGESSAQMNPDRTTSFFHPAPDEFSLHHLDKISPLTDWRSCHLEGISK